MYPDLTIKWTNPIQHERLIYKTKVQEIFYNHLIVILLLSIVIISLGFFLENYLGIIVSLSLALILFPYYIRPWEIVLSNKRLILRQNYWKIGRFSKIISFNLKHLDTQQVAPRLKLIPITLGFTLINAYSIPLLEFYLDGTIPTPILLKMIFIIFGSFPIIADIESRKTATLNLLYSPFTEYALYFSFITMIIGIPLIIFGLPRRKQIMLSTTGGHQLAIKTGVPDELSKLMYAIGRKHRIKPKQDDWDWDLPLLDDEEIKTRARIGLIDRKSQVIGLLSLIIFIDSIDQLILLIGHPNFTNIIVLAIKMINLFFIWVALSFAKKYRSIIATTHRLLYQEEIKPISGLYGKRIYQYNDLPYNFIQGFRYSNFTAIKLNTIFGMVIILSGIAIFLDQDRSSLYLFFGVLFIMLYLGLNYKIYTSLSFQSIGGRTMELFYRIPLFWINISHRMENRERIYSRFFPDILSENDIAGLCNAVRNVEEPVEPLLDQHNVSVNVFVDQHDIECGRWQKLGPFRHAKMSTLLGGFLSIYFTYLVFTQFTTPIGYIFILISIYAIIGLTLYNFIIRYRSLIIMKNRLFYIDEILPKKLSQFFGILPERSIQEVALEYVIASKFSLGFGKRINDFFKYIALIIISLFVLYSDSFIIGHTIGLLRDIIYLIFGVQLIVSIMPAVRLFFLNLPKYSLFIQTRFGQIEMPYMNNLENYNQALSKARDLE